MAAIAFVIVSYDYLDMLDSDRHGHRARGLCIGRTFYIGKMLLFCGIVRRLYYSTTITIISFIDVFVVHPWDLIDYVSMQVGTDVMVHLLSGLRICLIVARMGMGGVAIIVIVASDQGHRLCSFCRSPFRIRLALRFLCRLLFLSCILSNRFWFRILCNRLF